MSALSRRLLIASAIAAPFVMRTGLVRAQGGRTRLTGPLTLGVGSGQPYAQPQDAINDVMTNYDVAGFGANVALVGGGVTSPAIYNPFTVGGRAVGQNNGSLINVYGPDPANPNKVIILGNNGDAVTVNEGAHAVVLNMQAQTYGGTQQGKGFVCDGPGSRMDLNNCACGNVNANAFANVNGGFTRVYGSRPSAGAPSTNVISLYGSAGISMFYNANDGSKLELASVDINLAAGLGAGYTDASGFHQGYFAVAAQGYLHFVDVRIPNKSFSGQQYRFYQAAVYSDGGATHSSDGFFPGIGYELIEQSLYNGSILP